MQYSVPTVILAFLAVLPFTYGLYFHIAETERKCFIEEIPEETMVVGKFTQRRCTYDRSPYSMKMVMRKVFASITVFLVSSCR